MIATAGSKAQPRSVDFVRFGRPLLAVALVVLAYHESLRTLVDGLSLDTPLAHLALVPLITLVLLWMDRNPVRDRDIHDRQVDWIIGAPLVVTALLMNLILPGRLSTMFWVWRIDLLSMPIFVAGIVSLLFGVRTLWHQRKAIAFLFLAWPWPYNLVIDRWLGEFTKITISALKQVLRVIPLASPVVGADSIFEVAHAGKSIQMSVASACSGANGVVGFGLVGLALTFVVEGSRKRKAAWLLSGAVLVWMFNIVRIMVIFFAAKKWGEAVAIDGFHPVVGLVVFNIAVVLMLLTMGLFGLDFRAPRVARPVAAYRPQLRFGLVLVLVAVSALGVLNADLRSNDLVASSLGSPRLAAFATTRETPPGFTLDESARIDWARRFFGRDSEWVRYYYSSPGTEATAGVGLYADVISTSSRSALSAYGVEACYDFHGYKVSAKRSVDLGNGVVGNILTWRSPDSDTTWTTLYWHWPIKTATGTRYERVSLLMSDDPTNSSVVPTPATDATRAVQLSVADRLAGGRQNANDERIARTHTFLTGFAQEMVQLRIAGS